MDVIDVVMKVKGNKKIRCHGSNAWRLGYRNQTTPACGDNKQGFSQIMTGAKWEEVILKNLYFDQCD